MRLCSGGEGWGRGVKECASPCHTSSASPCQMTLQQPGSRRPAAESVHGVAGGERQAAGSAQWRAVGGACGVATAAAALCVCVCVSGSRALRQQPSMPAAAAALAPGALTRASQRPPPQLTALKMCDSLLHSPPLRPPLTCLITDRPFCSAHPGWPLQASAPSSSSLCRCLCCWALRALALPDAKRTSVTSGPNARARPHLQRAEAVAHLLAVVAQAGWARAEEPAAGRRHAQAHGLPVLTLVHTCTRAHTHTQTHTCIHSCITQKMHAHTHTCTCTCARVHAHACT